MRISPMASATDIDLSDLLPELEAEETSTEAQALAAIVVWSADCPTWQRDALRRLCTSEELSAEDIEELVKLCKGDTKEFAPLTLEHVRAPGSADAVVTLRSIHDVQNVNALASGERLSFDKKGLTVVYGDNGSGKSGYARILKKACRARSPKNDEVLPNIYGKRSGPQKAAVDFAVGGQNRCAEWIGGKPGDPLLSMVSVFDSRTANVHVDETNDVAYTPLPMKVLGQLAQLCQQIKKRIGEDVATLEQQTPVAIKTPECDADTAVGKLITSLGGKTKPEQVRALAKLSEAEMTRLAILKSDFAHDSAKTARQLQTIKARLEKHLATLEALKGAVTDEKVGRLRTLLQALQTARQAASAAADELFSDEPLPHVGSEIWRNLWEAARVYSQQEAYTEVAFPFTGDQARCVLCQQKLDEGAVSRLIRFEAFVKDETRRREEQAQAAYDEALDELHAADIAMEDIADLAAILRDSLADEALADEVRRVTVRTKWRLRAITRAHALEPVPPLPGMAAIPVDALSAQAAALCRRIAALLAEDGSEERKALRAEYQELLDREWLAVIEDDVIAEIGRRKQIASLKAAQKDTTTNKVTALSGEIAEHLITRTLRTEFTREVDKLGVAGLAIELRKQKTSYGVPLFRVSLIQEPEARVGDVLSEGEHRCVALAAFLAELATTEGKSAIVFDDPVSSLDHIHRKEVAERLADEAPETPDHRLHPRYRLPVPPRPGVP
jgi:energy-coupling factor transporter ATP-binding protein EcfA2